MTTEIEEKFYNTFNIEPSIIKCKFGGDGDFCPFGFSHLCSECDMIEEEFTYPPITSEIVLGLITVLVKKHCNLTLYWGLPKLTEQILNQCIKDSKDKQIQDQVKELFNGK